VFRDVVVHRYGGEWIAFGREPAVVGETLVLDLLDLEDGDPEGRFTVCVIESRPVIVDGEMRHRIRLHTDEAAAVLLEQQVRR